MTYVVNPATKTVAFEATFITPLAHADPSVSNASNEKLFLRRKMLLDRTETTLIDPADVDRLLRQYPAPASLADTLSMLSAGEYLAIALIKEWTSEYAYGVGLFDGVERYRRLEDRIKMAAVRAVSIFDFVGGLNQDMQVPTPNHYDNFAPLLGVPSALAWLMLKAFIDNPAAVIMLARAWNDAKKDDNVVVALKPVTADSGTQTVLDVPAISANSIRHETLREPAAWHLLNAVGLRFEDLPKAVAVLLYNGGDLRTAEPPNAFVLAQKIRAAYPSLGLMGGSCDGFILGSSNIEVNAWLQVRENNRALARYGIVSDVSAFDLLDRETMTRHAAGRVDSSPMPYGFESLIAGTKALIEFRFRPYATELEQGAFMAAMQTYIHGDSTLFGQGAKGFGLAEFAPIVIPAGIENHHAAYEDYLATNAESLRDGLLSGEMCSGKKVLG